MKKKMLLIGLIALMSLIAACGGGSSGSDEIIMDEPMPSGGEDAFLVELDFSQDTIIPNTVTVPAGEEVLFVIFNVGQVVSTKVCNR